jgi:hypothetical protein
MSWPGFNEFDGQYQHGVTVVRREHSYYPDRYHDVRAPDDYDHGYGYGKERRRMYHSGTDEDVVEGMYANEEREHEEPLYYRPSETKDGLPDRGLGKLLSRREEALASLDEKISEKAAECEESPMCIKADTKKEAFDSFLDMSHSAMSAKYAESEITKDPRKLSQMPVVLSASCVDEEIPKSAGVIIVNEKKFSKVQDSKFARDEMAQKKLQSSAISYVQGLVGLNFSMITNPNVEKKISSFIMKDEKSGEPVAKLSPYVMWDTSTSSKSPELLVDRADGFPSISEKEKDNVIEAGYMVTVLNKEGIRVNGNYGGKKGKIMQPGQSIYYGDVLVYPSRAKRMPVWIRVASSNPSELTGKEGDVAVSKMNAKMVPLRLHTKASAMKGFEGTAVRRLKIREVDGSSSVASKKGEDARVINASLQIDFKS